MNTLLWLLQWPIRALILLLIGQLPLGVKMENFKIALISAIVIGLLGTLLIWPLRFVLAPLWAITSVGGFIWPISLLFEWLITIFIFGLAAWLIKGFRLENGLVSAILGALVYSVLAKVIFDLIPGMPKIDYTRAAADLIGAAMS
ncbi:MAG: phage holin family protein [Synechococcaceae cyanobacterium]|jgi:putative membrane protein